MPEPVDSDRIIPASAGVSPPIATPTATCNAVKRGELRNLECSYQMWAARSPGVAGQAYARSEAHRVGFLPSARSLNAVRGKGVEGRAAGRDSGRSVCPARPILRGEDTGENYENREQN